MSTIQSTSALKTARLDLTTTTRTVLYTTPSNRSAIVESIIVSDDSGEKVSTNITKVMDYSELLGVSESITTNSEDLKETYTSKKKVKKSSVIGSNIIDNQHTSKFETLYLADGNVYEGNLHIHLDGSIMTGEKHSETAEDLYFKRNKMLISNRIFARQKPVEPRKRIRKIKTRSNY